MPLAGHLAYCAGAVGLLAVARHRTTPNDCSWLSLVLITAITCNPRMVDYDAAIAIIPAAAMLVDGLAAARLRTLTIALLAAFVVVSLGVNPYMGILLLLLSAAVVAYLNLGATEPC